jgi:hypothetical protein
MRQTLHELGHLPVPLARLKLKGRRTLIRDAHEHMPAAALQPDHLRAALPHLQPELVAEELFRRC